MIKLTTIKVLTDTVISQHCLCQYNAPMLLTWFSDHYDASGSQNRGSQGEIYATPVAYRKDEIIAAT